MPWLEKYRIVILLKIKVLNNSSKNKVSFAGKGQYASPADSAGLRGALRLPPDRRAGVRASLHGGGGRAD